MKILVAFGLMFCPLAIAHAMRDCPIMLLNSAATSDGITVTIRNAGKFAIHRMEFNCTTPGATKRQPMHCTENSPMFFPGSEYSVTFSYGGEPRAVMLSVKSLAMSNGLVWEPSRRDSCQTLTIRPPKQNAARSPR